jgi:putative glycosyltransferase
MTASGADVVYGVQEARKGGWVERVAGQIFFSVFNRMLTYPIPANVVTARLMTNRYVKALVSHQERELCLAGLWAITGFEQQPIRVRKGDRGESTYTTRKRVSALANAITSFSNRPLVYIFQIGVGVMVLSVVAGGILLYKSLSGEIGVPGWASIMVSIWFLGGLIIFCIGVIGMYLAKIFTEIKQRPYTIVRAEYGRERDSA